MNTDFEIQPFFPLALLLDFFSSLASWNKNLNIPTILSTFYFKQLSLDLSNSQGNGPRKLFLPLWKEFK